MIFFSCWATYIQIFFGKIHNIVTTTVTNSTNVEPVSYIYIIKPTGCQNNPGRVFPLDASASIPVLVIYEVKLKLCLIFKKISKWPPFWARNKLFTGSYTGSWIYQNIAISISVILSFWSTLWLKYWRRYIDFKNWPTLWPCDVINVIICTIRPRQLCTCKILFVWHQSFIVK